MRLLNGLRRDGVGGGDLPGREAGGALRPGARPKRDGADAPVAVARRGRRRGPRRRRRRRRSCLWSLSDFCNKEEARSRNATVTAAAVSRRRRESLISVVGRESRNRRRYRWPTWSKLAACKTLASSSADCYRAIAEPSRRFKRGCGLRAALKAAQHCTVHRCDPAPPPRAELASASLRERPAAKSDAAVAPPPRSSK